MNRIRGEEDGKEIHLKCMNPDKYQRTTVVHCYQNCMTTMCCCEGCLPNNRVKIYSLCFLYGIWEWKEVIKTLSLSLSYNRQQ